MKTVVRLMLGASALALAGCSELPGASLGATFGAESYLATDRGGPGFTGALASEYTELARSQAGNSAWMNATSYMAKARQAEGGAEPMATSPGQLGVNGETGALYDQVVSVIAGNKAERPEACARLQGVWEQYLFVYYAESNGAKCPLTADEALALVNEALAACSPSAAADFIVFFGFNQTDLTAEALNTVSDVVSSVQTLNPAGVSVVGHADTVGSVRYNQGLSERRANRVADALIDRGVPPGAIQVAGRSELDPAVVTGDGVREPRNRRVEISLSQ
ncbi:MAG: OmpA family protein [Pseudomonadota bacterium]